MSAPVLPGATLGVLGSGQLGRMFALAARRFGYFVHTFSPERHSPTGQVADREVVAAYEDADAVAEFVRGVDAVTFEFENVPVAAAEIAARRVPVRPRGEVLHVAQNRLREKTFLAREGLPTARFESVKGPAEVAAALERLGGHGVLKTAGFGYDGKGQCVLHSASEATAAWQAIGASEAILEAFVDFSMEVSVVAARGDDGEFRHFGVTENRHSDHVLDLSIADAPLPEATLAEAEALTRSILERLDVVGVLCVEFFVGRDGHLLINELAPRPHNSGHFTLDACMTSQFEQQVRALCGLPLGATERLCPAAMANLLGDLWRGGEPNWPAALADDAAKLHLYGKAQARPGRKMGHLNMLAGDRDSAARRALAARDALRAR